MAARTFYISGTVAAGSNHLSLVDSDPGTATLGTGWTVGTTAAGNYSLMAAGAERAATTFGTTAQPDGSGPSNTLGDCFRTTDVLDGRLSGSWTVTIPLIAVTAGGAADVAVTCRAWRSTSATGASATEITSGMQTLSTVTNLAVGVAQNSTVTATFAANGVGFVNEYLFLQVGLSIVGAGGGATDDVLIRRGSAAVVTVASWVPATLSLYDAVLDGIGFRLQWDGYVRTKAQTQAPTINTDVATIPGTLYAVSAAITNWSDGAGYTVSSTNEGYASGPGINISSATGQFQVGPRVLQSVVTSASGITALALASAAAVYAGGDNGMLYRQGATADEWASIGVITGGPRVNALAHSSAAINTTIVKGMWVGNATNGQMAYWDGAVLNQGTTANLGNTSSRVPLAEIHCLWGDTAAVPYLTQGVIDSNGGASINVANIGRGMAVIGKTASGRLVAAPVFSNWGYSATAGATPAHNVPWYSGSTFHRLTATNATINASVFSDWFGVYPLHTPGAHDPTTMPYSSGRQIYPGYNGNIFFLVANSSTPNGAIYRLFGTGAHANNLTLHEALANSYPVAMATMGTTFYVIDSTGTLYSFTSAVTSLSVVATGLTMGYGPPTAMHNYASALWIGFQAGQQVMYRRYGPSSAAGANVLSEPVYGATCLPASGSFNAAVNMGNNFYLGVNNGAATPIYRVDHTAYTTSPVSLASVTYDMGQSSATKSWRTIVINHTALVSGDTIAASYRINGTGSWVPMGSNSTVGDTSTTLVFNGTAVGLTVQIRVTLTSGSTSTTPVVTLWTVSAKIQQTFLREWKIQVKLDAATGYPQTLRDGSAEPQTGAAISSLVWTGFEAQGTYRFRDIDGTIYNVEIYDYSERLMPGLPQSFGTYQYLGDFTLREVA